MLTKQYYVYIMTNYSNNVLYTGVTNDIIRRTYEYKSNVGSKFTSNYKITKLVYYEVLTDINEAINREKQIKAGSRKNKIELIKQFNPKYRDLYDEVCK